MGLFRADSGFYDKAIVAFLKGCKINHIISARLTQTLQQAMVDLCQWQDVAPGLQISELRYQPHGWEAPQRLVVIRQHIQRKAGGVPGKTLSLFADDPDLQGWRYGAMLTDMSLPAIAVWNLYRGRAGREHAGLQLDECLSPHSDAPEGPPHTCHTASQGTGRWRVLGEPQGKT